MTIIIVQCRLDSTRLPRKALLPLGGRPLVAWTLAAMKRVPAEHYILAVEYDSFQELEPVAKDCRFQGGCAGSILCPCHGIRMS